MTDECPEVMKQASASHLSQIGKPKKTSPICARQAHAPGQ
jgi:hypothetical protein